MFFGENLPEEYSAAVKPEKLKATDLLIVIGTALAVSPFNSIPNRISDGVPKVLINMENTLKTGHIDFTKGDDKLFLKGKCDEVIAKLVKDVGWGEDFDMLLPEILKKSILYGSL